MRKANTFRNRSDLASRAAMVLAMMVLSLLLGASVHAQQVITTFSLGNSGDPFKGPQNVVFDSQGNLFVADAGNHRIQRIDKSTGAVTTVVGTGTAGDSGDGGAAIKAQINCPTGLAFGLGGQLLIADSCAGVVRLVAASTTDGLIKGRPEETISQFGAAVGLDFSTKQPNAVAVDAAGNVYVGTITDNPVFGFVNAGTVTEYDGTGNLIQIVVSELSVWTINMALDSTGNVYAGGNGDDDPFVACASNGTLDTVLTGNINIYVRGFADATGNLNNLNAAGIAMDASGNLYTNVQSDHSINQLKAGPAGFCSGDVGSINPYVGTGQEGFSGDGGAPADATLHSPRGLAFNTAGNLFIADSGNNAIRAVLKGASTAAGTTVTVDPLDQNGVANAAVSVEFDNVTSTGGTAVVTGVNGPVPPANFELAGTGLIPPPMFYDIVTSAKFSGNVTVCITPSISATGLSLWHFNTVMGTWEQISTPSIKSGTPICGVVTSLSPFALLEPVTKSQAPAITSGSSSTFQTGVAGSFSVTTTGSPTPAISASGSLPGAVKLTDNGDGTAGLSGTPGAATGGTYPITITATNGVSPDATQSFVLTVNQAPAIVSANSATFTVGTLGAFSVTATGFPAPTLSETGALPGGVNFNPATGTLSGTPTNGGVFTLTMTAGNGVGTAAVQTFTLTVNQAPAITSANNATFTAGSAGSFKVTSTGFPTPTLSETGALPAGTSFVSNGDGTGTLSGTPTVSGVFTITLTANNGVGSGASQGFTLTVSGGSGGPIVTLTPASLNFGNVPLYHLATGEVNLRNTGTSRLAISKMSLTLGANTDRDEFLFLSLCGNTLAPGKSCNIYFLFYADKLGSHSATLNITDNAAGGQNSVALTGAAIKPVH